MHRLRTEAAFRPYVLLNAAMSLDGKIATSGGESRLSSLEDLKRVHRVRAKVGGIMIGIGTLLADDPKLTAKLARGRNPQRIVVDSNARTPTHAHVVTTALETPTIIAVTTTAPKRRVRELRKAGVIVLRCGKGPLVSLPILLKRLRVKGIKQILLEGGGTLSWSMLSKGLVDEISVAISPRILGGAGATTLVEGEGFKRVRDAIRLRLTSVNNYGEDLVLRYRVLSNLTSTVEF
jgi:2,5-diamino-6-(ribosylamino)-4(3H)-pyrimidinone 5'-phosphate reductase